MTLPVSGAISLSDVNVELNLSATAQISLGDAAVRSLFDVSSGAISMSDGYGKANLFTVTLFGSANDLNLRSYALSLGWNGYAAVEVTIGSSAVISGTVQANSTAALTVDGSWPNGVTLINNGSILGRGGDGGAGGNISDNLGSVGSPGSAGGRALLVSTALTLQNNGIIAGGGGGGGGGGTGVAFDDDDSSYSRAAGGGGGGGQSSSASSSGGAAGIATGGFVNANGGAGGTGTTAGGGARGAGSELFDGGTRARGGSGGFGGAYGTAGEAGYAGEGGGGGQARAGGAAGAAGQAISGNANITYTATGTRLGPIV